MFYGQHREDEYICTLFPKDFKGTCVDVGAHDGIEMSNTYYFEKRGWRCLCVEPIDESYKKCALVRKETVQCCIADEDKEDQVFDVFHIWGNVSGVSSLKPDKRLIETFGSNITKRESRRVLVKTLTTVLREHQFPYDIDFISIDTENTELDVLKGLDFNTYNVKLFIIENNFNDPDCENFLKGHGYHKINRIAVNDFFWKST